MISPSPAEHPPQQLATLPAPNSNVSSMAAKHKKAIPPALAVTSGANPAASATGFQSGSPEIFALQDLQPTASKSTGAEHLGQYHMSSNVIDTAKHCGMEWACG
jgi:hypothetical protein